MTPELLARARLVAASSRPVKILGDGEIGKALTVRRTSSAARRQAKIAAAGGRLRGAFRVETPCRASPNIFTVPDLRKRVLFTLGLLAVYRLGAHIPTPGVNPAALHEFFEQHGAAQLFGFLRHVLGRQPAAVTIFALGIMPYISASIILQLLTVVWPYLEKLSKEGELGRRKITQYTRYGTVLLSHRPVARHRGLPREADAPGGAPARRRTRAGASG